MHKRRLWSEIKWYEVQSVEGAKPPVPQELAPLSFQIYETGLLHRSLNLLAADISNCFYFSNYLSSYLEKKEKKKNIEKSSRMSESERILRVVIPILTVKERGEGKNHG